MNPVSSLRPPVASPRGATAAAESAWRRELRVALPVLSVMVLTRATQSGAITLPDASVAAFFLLGAFSASRFWPAIGLILAAVVDALVTGDIRDYCSTPAALFLIPTYVTMWAAGRVVRHRGTVHARPTPAARLLSVAAILLVAATASLVAFLISSGSFYLFSGQFPNLTPAAYASVVLVRYLPPYVGYCLMYVTAGLAISWLAARSRSTMRARGP